MKKTILACVALIGSLAMSAQRTNIVQPEKLDRGVIAVKTNSGVFVSWRYFASDDKALAFDVYRGDTKVNATPLKSCTNFTDPAGKAGDLYSVKAVLGSDVKETSAPVAAWDTFYKKIHLDRPAGGTSPAGGRAESRDYTYTPDDISVGDVDGDGEWELIVKWFPTNQADNGDQFRYTGNTILDCYKFDGTKLWRIDLGQNIRSGNHYTQFMVYDFDGDGKAELICKTAPGTIDGKNNPVLMGSDKVTDDYRTKSGSTAGVVVNGPEYLTVFNGQTGAQIHTIAYNPPRTIRTNSQWGDGNGNRCERYLACVAYLDGQKPSAVFCRGYYTAAYLWAVDFDGTQLKERWLHKSEQSGSGLYGEGAHSLTVGDVDGDGKDEIVYGAACLDDDGTVLYRTGAGHGDALHLTDMLPDHQGLEVFMPHEEKTKTWGTELRDAKTGEILYCELQKDLKDKEGKTGLDVGRGLAANISARYPGYETWSSTGNGVFNNGTVVGTSTPRSTNFRIYWDGDPQDELFDGRYSGSSYKSAPEIQKVRADLSKTDVLMTLSNYSNAGSCNTTKGTPNLQADLFGDWREEIILHDQSTESDLIIFTTTTPSDYRVPTLMQDRQYRLAVAWQNVGYNQPPHLSYNLEESFNRAGRVVVTEGTLSQVVDLGDAVRPVVFKVERATDVTVIGLPDGVTMEFDKSALTGKITGTPAEEGEYTFTLTTLGAEDGNDGYSEGTIKVRRNTNLKLAAQFEFEKAGETTVNNIYGTAKVEGTDASVVEGKKGNALSLGGNSYLSQEGYEFLDFGKKDFTIEMWLKSADDAAYIFQKGTMKGEHEGGPAGATGNWAGIEYKSGELRFAVDDGTKKSEYKWADGSKVFDDKWHHVVVIRDTYAKALSMYVDGEFVGSADDESGSVNCPDETMFIGCSANRDNTFAGLIDEFSIYQGVMSASKVKERYESTGTHLAYFAMDELGSTTPNRVYGEATVNGDGIEVVTGVKAGALNFNNTGYLTQPVYDAISMGEGDFTIEMWMKSTDEDGYLFCIGTHNKANVENGTGNWIGIERKKNDKNNYLCFSIDDDKDKSDCRLDDVDNIFDGNWHYVAAVRDFAAKTLTLYIDGVEKARATGVKTGALKQSENELMYIGGDDETSVSTGQDAHRTFAGTIDELVITPRALTAAEVAADYDMLKLSSIEDVEFNNANATYTVVDAMTGIIVRTAIGVDREDIMDGLGKGVYILVVEDGNSSKNYKFVK